MVDGREKAGNSLGRGLLGGGEAKAWTPWTDGKAWLGESLEGARWKRRQGGRTGNSGKYKESSVARERDGSVATVDG